ncbi:MAG: class I SAM-dependent methyltransferase [Nitrospiraceae bacterium]|nr:class I SAM-dependent methyltransferase [Nitrospiraceae bacterium]
MGAAEPVMLKSGVDLHQAVLARLVDCPRGRVLDVGAGSGGLARKLKAFGHETAMCDCLPASQWADHDAGAYTPCDLNTGLPYPDESFDYVICLEVIEHMENPLALCRELKRVLRKGGRLFISTPNILSLKSRVKFLLDGSFVFFNYPPIEWDQRDGRPNVHVYPIRLHELEYYLYKAGLEVAAAFTNLRSYSWRLFFPLEWLIRLYARHMTKRSHRPDRIPLDRIYGRILTDDLLFGTHLIIEARNAGAHVGQGVS